MTTEPGDELVDVIDAEDRVIGTATRRRMRAEGLGHRCTYILVRNGAGEVLVHRRTDSKDIHPGLYDLFAGGVCGAGEGYEACARREVAEELGVAGAPLRFLLRHRYEGLGGPAWGAVYEVRWDGPVRHQPSEVAWSAWVSPARLDAMLAEHDFCPDSREIYARLRAR